MLSTCVSKTAITCTIGVPLKWTMDVFGHCNTHWKLSTLRREVHNEQVKWRPTLKGLNEFLRTARAHNGIPTRARPLDHLFSRSPLNDNRAFHFRHVPTRPREKCIFEATYLPCFPVNFNFARSIETYLEINDISAKYTDFKKLPWMYPNYGKFGCINDFLT